MMLSFFFVFKQKTAYEMRISDWSSDVCSSDLQAIQAGDFDAARSAAAALWDSGDRRFDAQLVLTVDALRRSDWKAARTYLAGQQDKAGVDVIARSEERRVGQESVSTCRSRLVQYH